MRSREPFNPADPFDALADGIKSAVVDIGASAIFTPEFRGLAPERAVECFTAGVLTGLMGVLFSVCAQTTESHDALERFVTSYVPQARAQAEDIAASGEPRQ